MGVDSISNMVAANLMNGFPDGSAGEESTCTPEDMDSVPGLGRSLGGGHGNPLRYSCWENPSGGGTWWATVHGIAESWT